MELVSLGTGVKYLKAGFLGFSKSGKTYTALELALGTWKKMGLKGPIALFDTEAAAQYVAPRVKEATGKELIGVQSRSLGDMVLFLQVCLKKGVSVALVDSVTHPWRELCKSYLEQKNDALDKRGRSPQSRIEFQDWGPIKEKWGEFTDLYLNSELHIIICGRAGDIYEYQDREDGSGKDLVKTGVKMKTETEFGFEPSLLVEMERIQVDASGKLAHAIIHRATVLGDRFSVIDGRTADDPTFGFFEPYIDCLTGKHVAVDTTRTTDMDLNEEGQAKRDAERKRRAILLEEIENMMTKAYPGRSAVDTKAKIVILENAFGTSSWEAVKMLDIQGLERGKDILPDIIKIYQEQEAAPAKPARKAKGA